MGLEYVCLLKKDWKVNQPERLNKVLKVLEKIQGDFNSSNKNKAVSMADLIVLGGCVACEDAAKKSGTSVRVPLSLVEWMLAKIKRMKIPWEF